VSDDLTLGALTAALGGLAARQRVIATNTANIETPGYLAKRVSFENELAAALRDGGSSSAAAVTPTEMPSLEPTRMDGNNVNLDRETLMGTDTEMRYQLMVRAVDAKFGLLRSAIRG
jgi:flagellar basal-body rod protein FlgB